MKYVFWVVFCTFGFVTCLVAGFYLMAADYKKKATALKQLKADNKADAIRKSLTDAENQYNNAETDGIEAAIYELQAIMSKANTEIRALKTPEQRHTEYQVFKWLNDEAKEKKHNIRLFYESNKSA